MLLLVSGGYNGDYNSHLVFISELLGYPLSLAYQFLPGLEWYTVSLLLIQTWAFNTLLHFLLKNSSLPRYLSIAFILALFLRFNLNLQFTTVAGISAITACCRLSTSYQNLSGYQLLFLALTLRFNAAILCVVFMLPLMHILSKGAINQLLKRVGIALGLTMLVFGFDFLSQQQNEAWSNYHQFRKLRSSVADHPSRHLDMDENSSEEALLLETDIICESISSEALEALHSKQNQHFRYWPSLWRIIISQAPWLLIIILFLSFLAKKRPYHSLFIFVLLACSLAFLHSFAIVKFRVFILMLLPIFLFCAINEQAKKAPIQILFLILTSGFLFTTFKLSNRNLERKQRFKQELLPLFNFIANSKTPCLNGPTWLPIEEANPFKLSKLYPTSLLHINGWAHKLPIKNQVDNPCQAVEQGSLAYFSTTEKHLQHAAYLHPHKPSQTLFTSGEWLVQKSAD